MKIQRARVGSSGPARKWPLPFRAWITCAIAVLAPLLANAAAVSEHRVKAAFLYNFTKFVSWPEDSFTGPEAPMVLGVFGESRVAGELELLIKDRKMNGRGLRIKRVESAEDLDGVHLLFVPVGEERRFGRIDERIQQQTLLIVADAEACTEARAAICFVQQGDQLRFTIDAKVSGRSRLEISSNLQKLAANFNKP